MVQPVGKPSVCQSGSNAAAGSVGSALTPLPSEFIVYRRNEPGCAMSLVNAIFFPSGDHAGPSSSCGELVRRVSPLPSTPIV